ncbi:hypothetical protein [Clostridium beijerinckii]|nr:hypothetical protein [Clostridium beijerinckii]
MSKINRKVLLGITSLMLFALGILFGISLGGNPSYGDLILKSIGLGPWSNIDTGLHYTAIISLIFLIPAVVFEYMFLKETLELENMNGKRRIETLECKLSILIVLISTFVLPGKIEQNMGSFFEYAFGFPLNYWSVYQGDGGSSYLFGNLFNGNIGMNINIVNLFLDIVILYYVLLIIRKVFIKLYAVYKKN